MTSPRGSASTGRDDGDGLRAIKNTGANYFLLYDGDTVLSTASPTGVLAA